MKLTKGLIFLLVFTFVIGGVSAAVISNVLTKAEFAEAYPFDPFVKRAGDCGGLSDTTCLMAGAKDMTCMVEAETEHDGKRYFKFKCQE